MKKFISGNQKFNQNLNQKERKTMKKFISIMVVVSMITAMSTTALAAPVNPDWDPQIGHTRLQEGNPETVPMYGYIGPVVEIPIDPDPDDPEVNPWAPLNISVPVKFIWAAFEPSDGSIIAPVEAPQYKIINHSTEQDVEVIVTNFTTDTPIPSTVGTVALNLKKVGSTGTITNEVVLANHGTAVTFPQTVGVLAADTAPAGTGTEWLFTIGGQFDANVNWPTTIQLPVYKVEFSFKIDK